MPLDPIGGVWVNPITTRSAGTMATHPSDADLERNCLGMTRIVRPGGASTYRAALVRRGFGSRPLRGAPPPPNDRVALTRARVAKVNTFNNPLG